MANAAVLKAALSRLPDEDRAKLHGLLHEPPARRVRKATRSVSQDMVRWAWRANGHDEYGRPLSGRQWSHAEPDADPLANF
jgi:hypothetical protein